MPQITYNGYTLPYVFDKFSYHEDEKQISVSCNFLVTASSASALVGTCKTVEEKLTEINKNLTIIFGGSSEMNFSHTGNTGFLARPTLSKTTGDGNTATSRIYSFSCVVGLPFVQTPYNRRREASYTITYADNRQKTISFKVLYTASGDGSAEQNYINDAKVWAQSVLTEQGSSYELLSENFNLEQENKILNGSLQYKEILSNKSITSSYGISYLPSRQRVVTFNCVYMAVESDNNTNAVRNYDINAKAWASSVLATLGGTYELIGESIHPEQKDRVLTGNLTYKEILSDQTIYQDDVGLVDLQAMYSIDVAQQVGVFLTDESRVATSEFTITMTYSASVNRDAVLSDLTIDDTYTNRIRPRLITHAKDVVRSDRYNRNEDYIIQSERKSINIHTYTISGTIVLSVPKTLTQISEIAESITTNEDENIVTDKIWNGQDHTYNIWKLGKIKTITRTVAISQIELIPSTLMPLTQTSEIPGIIGGEASLLLKNSSNTLSAIDVGQGTSITGLNKVRIYTRRFVENYLVIKNSVPAVTQ